MLEVYIEGHFFAMFNEVHQYIMRLNLENFTFGVKGGMFMGFYLTERGIKANLDKCDAIF